MKQLAVYAVFILICGLVGGIPFAIVQWGGQFDRERPCREAGGYPVGNVCLVGCREEILEHVVRVDGGAK